MADMSSMFYCGMLEYDSGPRGILNCCSLCTKPLLKGRDIFMYQGDTPFCSEECRQEQIDIDQEKEFRRNYANRRSVSSSSSGKHGRELKQIETAGRDLVLIN